MTAEPYSFCPVCGDTLVEREMDDRTRQVCPSCKFVHYRNPPAAAAVALLDGEEILLVERRFEPRAGMWTLPAGFLEADEDIKACAVREVKEETNLDCEIVKLINVYSVFDDPRMSVVLVVYLGKRVGGELRCGDDASDARYFKLDRLPKDIAFRAHATALREIRARLEEGSLWPPGANHR